MTRPPPPSGATNKVKLAVIVGVLALTTVWITYQLSSMFRGLGVARPLDTPGWRRANEITKKLNENLKFNSVGLAVVSESPLQLRAEGLVQGPRTLDELKAFLATEIPEATIEYEVVVMP